MSIKQLDELKIKYLREGKWVGEKGVQCCDFVHLNTIKSVQLPLTPNEWCSLCMREGGNYIGSCCRNMSRVQNVLNEVFRNSGWIEAADFRHVVKAYISHGEESFEDKDLLKKVVNKGSFSFLEKDSASPWLKIAVTWQIVKDILVVEKKELPVPTEINRFEDALEIANKHLTLLRYKKIFAMQQSSLSEDSEEGQCKYVEQMDLAASLAALRIIYDVLDSRKNESISGFGLRNEKGDLGVNYFGACLYEKKRRLKKC